MKILLTGANGLLGSCFCREISATDHELVRGGNNDLSNGAVRVDICDFESINTALSQQDFTHIINCAADRDPESCLMSPVQAYAINAAGVENLARAAIKHNIKLCHISTDYVFDGKNPPYAEDARTFPLNAYGRSKLAGELAAMTVPRHLVLRIPALYRADITDKRNLLYKINQDLAAGKEIKLDNKASRFYTLADDISHAALMLLEKDIQGIVHLSAQERATKSEFARIFARAAGYDPSLIIDIDAPAPAIEKRPDDSHLSTEYFQTLCDFEFSPPSMALKQN